MVKRWGELNTLEKEMAPHSTTLAWRIPWTEEPGRLQSMGLLRRRRGQQRMRWLDGITDSMDMSLGKLRSDPMDCSLPDSSVRGILQARVVEWGAIAFSIELTIC